MALVTSHRQDPLSFSSRTEKLKASTSQQKSWGFHMTTQRLTQSPGVENGWMCWCTDGGSNLSPDWGLRIKVFEAFGHADGQQHQRKLFLWRDKQLWHFELSYERFCRHLVEAGVSSPFVFQPPVRADSACNTAASYEGPELPSWPVPLAAPPLFTQRHTHAGKLVMSTCSGTNQL